jgi:hypothetical protein
VPLIAACEAPYVPEAKSVTVLTKLCTASAGKIKSDENVSPRRNDRQDRSESEMQ